MLVSDTSAALQLPPLALVETARPVGIIGITACDVILTCTIPPEYSYRRVAHDLVWPSSAILFPAGRQRLPDCAKHGSVEWSESLVR